MHHASGARCKEARLTMTIALFLGAGASAPYGMPTTIDLRDRIKYTNSGFPRKDLLDYGQFPDIEHVLSMLDDLIAFADSRAGKLYAESGGWFPPDGSDGAARRAFSTRRNSMNRAYKTSADAFKAHVEQSRRSREIIEHLIAENYKWNPSNNNRLVQMLRPLFDLVQSKEGHVTIFTTNYDTAIEAYCGSATRKSECVDGFKLHRAKRMHVWDGKFIPRNKKPYKKVILYKLHGSMSWIADETGGRGCIAQLPYTSASGDPSRNMYIRPSLDTKDEATQKEPYATILREFAGALHSFDMCIVIGYSFRDSHISEELVRFARSGRILFLISPNAATDFRDHALKEGPASRKNRWRVRDGLHKMTIGSGSRKGIVYALNEKLATDSVDSIIDVIKSAIKESASSRKMAAGSG